MTHAKTDLLKAEAEMLAAGLTLQTQTMGLLLAEMRGLSDLMAGAALTPPHDEAKTEAETEDGFDNMPV